MQEKIVMKKLSLLSLKKQQSEKKWWRMGELIYFTVTSDGTSGAEWLKRLEEKGIEVETPIKQLFLSEDFRPSSGITTECCLLRGTLWEDNTHRTTENVRAKARELELLTPNIEVACLAREKLSDQDIEDMGLWWVTTMHKSVKDFENKPRLLSLYSCYNSPWIGAAYDNPNYEWHRTNGFIFESKKILSLN